MPATVQTVQAEPILAADCGDIRPAEVAATTLKFARPDIHIGADGVLADHSEFSPAPLFVF